MWKRSTWSISFLRLFTLKALCGSPAGKTLFFSFSEYFVIIDLWFIVFRQTLAPADESPTPRSSRSGRRSIRMRNLGVDTLAAVFRPLGMGSSLPGSLHDSCGGDREFAIRPGCGLARNGMCRSVRPNCDAVSSPHCTAARVSQRKRCKNCRPCYE